MEKPTKRKMTIAGLAAAGVLGVGIAAPAVALAQDGSDPAATPSATATADPGERSERGRWGEHGRWSERGEHGRWGERGERGEWGAERRAALAEALAAELGVSQEDVTAALEKVREQLREEGNRPDGERPERAGDPKARLQERLDAAVAAGTLTQQEADAVLKAYEAKVLMGGGPGGHGPR